jgi:transcription elongation factor Elf1
MKKPICPIGLECSKRYCPNHDQCKDLTHSWEIPYYFEKGALIVKKYGWRCEWHEEAQGLGWEAPRRCTLPSGDYRRLDGNDHEYEMKERLKESWKEAGWAAAVDLPLPSPKPVEPPKRVKKIETCPYCESEQIYRKQRESFTLYCDECGHHWESDKCEYRGFRIQIGLLSYEIDGKQVFWYHCLLEKNIQEGGYADSKDEAASKAKADIDDLISHYGNVEDNDDIYFGDITFH